MVLALACQQRLPLSETHFLQTLSASHGMAYDRAERSSKDVLAILIINIGG